LVTQLLDGGFSEVVAVNPKAQGMRDIPAVRSFAEFPESALPVDLAIVASPAATVADVLEDAGHAGVKVAVVITAGFAESGNSQEEQRILAAARRHGVRIVGPNCAGIVNTKHRLYPTLETRPPSGDVAFVSQSGALGGAVLSWAKEQGVGISKFVSYGNAADLSEIDFLEALRDDNETKVVALYIETISDGRRFMDAARRLSAVKPLIVIKSGRSDSGGRATQSHTGSMAGSDAVYEAALAQCGAIRVAGIEEMFDLCRGFVHLPPVRGKRIAIVTNSGGPGVLAADAGDALGLEIAPPSLSLRDRLSKRLPSFCSLINPFDLTVQGTEDDYRDALIETLAEYDAAIAINVNTPYLDVAPLARGVVAAFQETGKPIAASFVAGEPAQAALPVLAAGGVPNFVTGERCVRVLARMSERRLLAGASASAEGQDAADRQPLPWPHRPTEPEVLDWLEAVGVPTIPRAFARTCDEAMLVAEAFGDSDPRERAFAMKIVSPTIMHKTDVGGVALDLKTPDEIKAAFSRLERLVPPGAFQGVLLSLMISHPVEVLVGVSTDPQFGPVIAVGLGGIYTEIFKDLSLSIAPVTIDEAHSMLAGLKGIDLLTGARGAVLRDTAALARLVSDVSRLPFRFRGIGELDLNPVFLFERGCAAGDARLIPAIEATDRRSD
jgi:acyl-CoA synthetase (NDP forming)